MSARSSPSTPRSGTPLDVRPHSSIASATTSLSSSLSQPKTSSERNSSSNNNENTNGNSNYFSYPVSRVVSGLYRRLTDPPQTSNSNNRHARSSKMTTTSTPSSSIYSPRRTVSPFQPPPLTPLTLRSSNATGASAQPYILSRSLAEEIRLLLPPRLQLVDTWRLAYSLERDGSSLTTLYDTCRHVAEHNPRTGYVLVVRDTSDGGALFGAYLSDAPHPASHFYGTGECFLWRASVLGASQDIWSKDISRAHHNHHHNNDNNNDHHDLNNADNHVKNGYNKQLSGDNEYHTLTTEELQRAGFPPPPSADTTYAVRSTTLRASTPTRTSTSTMQKKSSSSHHLLPSLQSQYQENDDGGSNTNGTSTPERIRFKAFPYSGINDYMIFCETGFLSVGGG